jgi:hypothetical protein
MPEVLTRVDEGDSPAVDYKKGHLLPRLRESVDEAAGYIVASLQDNIDSPESIALAFQDVAEAYELPIDVSVKSNTEHQRLQREVLRCAKLFTRIKDGPLDATWVDRTALADNDLDDAVRKLLAFEAEHKIGVDHE